MGPTKQRLQFEPLIKVMIVGSITGGCTGLSFILVERLLSVDHSFSLFDLSIALITPSISAILVGAIAQSRIVPLIIIAYFTFMIPVFGPALGGTGSESIWAFGFLGAVGGLVWSVPRVIWNSIRKSR